MSELIINISKSGLHKIFKEYELKALRYIWSSSQDGAGSGDIHQYVNNNLDGKKISRASIIGFLNDMAEMNVLRFDLRSGKGGMRRIYFPVFNETELIMQIVRDTLESYKKDFPNETKLVIEEFSDIRVSNKKIPQPVSSTRKRSLKDLFER